MKASDFFLGTRQLFGFLFPGALWIAVWMLIHKISPADYLTEQYWIPKLLSYLGVSYVVGFSVQTGLFALIMEYQEWKSRRKSQPHPAEPAGSPSLVPVGETNRQAPSSAESEIEKYRRVLLDCVRQELTEQPGERLAPANLPRFCKNFVLENSIHLREQILELEGEINLMAGIALPLMFLPISWMIYKDGSVRDFWPAIVGAFVISMYFLFRRVPKVREGEELMWCEMYLILRLRSGDPKVENK